MGDNVTSRTKGGDRKLLVEEFEMRIESNPILYVSIILFLAGKIQYIYIRSLQVYMEFDSSYVYFLLEYDSKIQFKIK